jgi:hypothetical protein
MPFDVEWIGILVFALVVLARFFAARRSGPRRPRESRPKAGPVQRQPRLSPPAELGSGEQPPPPIEPR